MKRGRPPKAKMPEIEQQYDYDRFEGRSFFEILPDILNKRYADGWKYVDIYKLGVNTSKMIDGEYPLVYGVLYERIVRFDKIVAPHSIDSGFYKDVPPAKRSFNKCSCGSDEQSVTTSCGTDGVGVRMHYVVCHKCMEKGPERILAEDAVLAWNAANPFNI